MVSPGDFLEFFHDTRGGLERRTSFQGSCPGQTHWFRWGVPILRNWHIKRSNIGNIILQLDLDVRFYSYMICCIYIHDILMISLYDLYDYHLSLCSIVILSLSVLLPFPHQKNPLRLTHRSWWKPRRCQVWLGWKKHKEVRNSFI